MSESQNLAEDGLRVRLVADAEVALCRAIRRAVFIEEQGVSEADEIDGKDNLCQHILAISDGVPVGAARLSSAQGITKIQRVCVLKSHRGTGIGAAIVAFAVADARQREETDVVLGAQVNALAFYERLGFAPYGDVFDDAGIPHKMMRLRLSSGSP